MRMKKTAGAVAISTLTLAGLGIAGATAAHADVWNVPCNTYHDASLTGGPTQCFKYSGSGNNVIEVDGYGQVCASSVYNVKVIYQGGATYTTRPGYCAPAGGIYQFYIGDWVRGRRPVARGPAEAPLIAAGRGGGPVADRRAGLIRTTDRRRAVRYRTALPFLL